METSLKLYAYVLECVENKYYVGIAYNLEKRILQHILSGKRSAIFTKIYKPIKCIATYDLNTESKDEAELFENLLTVHYAKKYGYENVAGGKFCVRDMLQRRRSIEKFVELDEILIQKKKYKISEINLFQKITEIEFELKDEKLLKNKIELNNFEPYDFYLISNLTTHIQPLKKRLLIILSLIYKTKVGRMVKIKMSCIHRSSMTISIPTKRKNKFVEYPIQQELLASIEEYYRNENDKPIDYLFPSKWDKQQRMGITDEYSIIEEIEKKIPNKLILGNITENKI